MSAPASISHSTAVPAPRRNVLNVVSNWGGFAANAVVSLFLAPFVVHTLGDAQYGIWILLASIVGYLGLLDLGVRGAVTRYVANLHAAGNHAEAERIACSALSIFLVAGLAAVLVAAGLAAVVTRIFNIPPDLVGVARLVFLIGGVSMASSLVAGVFGGVVVGLQRFDLLNLVGVVTGLARAGLIVVTLSLGGGLVGLALIQLGVSVAQGVANYAMSRRLYPQIRVRPTGWSRAHASQIVSFGMYSTLLHASGALLLYTDSVVIGAFLPVYAVTLFAIGATLADYARQVVTGISTTVTPMVSALEARGDRTASARAVLSAARLANLVLLPILITLLLRGASFIALWMGGDYVGHSDRVLWILALTLSPFVAYQILTSAAFGLNAHRTMVPVYVAEALVNLGLSLFLVQYWGIFGVAWGTAIPRLFVSMVLGPWFARRLLGIPLGRFVTQAWLLPWSAMVPFAAASTLIDRWWPAANLAVFFAQIALTLILAAAGAWLVALTPSERKEAAAWVAAPVRALRRPTASR